MNTHIHRAGLLLVLLAGQTSAQEAAVSVGRWDLYPTLGISVGIDDNLTLSSDAALSSEYLVVQPAVRLETATRRSDIRFQASIDKGEFFSSDRDDYQDHELSGQWRYRPGVRSDLLLRLARNRGHDRRGEGLRENFLETLDRDVDEYDVDTLSGRYTFGSDGARGRLAVFAEGRDKAYRNNRDITSLGNFDLRRLGAEFGWRFASRTSLLAQVTRTTTDYRFANLDGNERSAALGLQWDGTAKTNGRFLIGRLSRDFDDRELDGFSGSFWEVAAAWRPRQRAEISLLSRRSTDEAFGGANFLVREETSLAWRHNWRPRFVTALDISVLNEDFSPQGRDDDIRRVGFSADYQFRRWLLFGAGVRRVERDSPVNRFDYSRNEVVLSVQLSL
ncbi:MAG: outer membrane beta-barrel protein [Lysobacterales bacterium]